MSELSLDVATAAAVAYQGMPGAYSESAARALVGPDATLMPCSTLEDTFQALATGRAAHAVVPVENTLAGSVTKSYDLLLEHDVIVVGEHVHQIDHVLIAPPGVRLEQIARVMSHPVALAQCERFFRTHPGVTAVPVFDTAGAVPMAMVDPTGDAAAIASRDAARLYGGVVVLEHVQDHPRNFTRFLLLRGGVRPAATERKTLLAFGLPNTAGSLWTALEPFAVNAINLTKIESRPVAGRPFEYAFVIEIEHEGDARAMAAACDEVAARTAWLRILGSFAPAPLP